MHYSQGQHSHSVILFTVIKNCEDTIPTTAGVLSLNLKTKALRTCFILSQLVLWGCEGENTTASDGIPANEIESVDSASPEPAESIDSQAGDSDSTPGKDASSELDPTVAFYDPWVVQEIQISIAESDRNAMFEALPERIYVPATFRWNDITIENVGVRFKGNSSSNPNATHKRSYLIKFGEYVDGQRFLGLRRVALDNAVQFGSLFSERFIDDVLREEGVTISRSNYARLVVNDEVIGAYVNVERIDKSFLERYFGNRDGILYKNHEGGPGAILEVLDAAGDYAQSFEPKTHEDEADYTDLQELALLLRDTPDAELADTLESRFAVDSMLRMMAVFMLSGAFDQYTGWAPHNFYLYDDPETGRWSYLAWDLDVGFADNAFGQVKVIDQWNASWPLPNTPRPLIERLLNNEEIRTTYRTYASDYLERHFHPDVVASRLDALWAVAQIALDGDTYPPYRVTNPNNVGWENILNGMKAFSEKRYNTAKAQLANPLTEAPVYENTPGSQGPAPGPPSSDAPSNLQATTIEPGNVVLTWTDNAEGEMFFAAQRCSGSGCTDFKNHVGIEGENMVSVVDPAVKQGQTYRYRVYAVHSTPEGPKGTGVSNAIEVSVP